MAMMRAMRHVVAIVTVIRLALSARRDLLLEMLALHHQVAVLARSNRRFGRSDRLLWLILRRLWPQWRDALVLVQPATVDRWYRDRIKLKLGIVVSERTVSRYLTGRPKRPSQTWRTFLANHLGQFACMSSVLSTYAPADDVVDAFARTCRSTQSSDRLSASSRQCARTDWPASVRPKCLGLLFTQEHLCDRRNTRRIGRAPPRTACGLPTHGGYA